MPEAKKIIYPCNGPEVKFRGVAMSASEWSEVCGLTEKTIRNRLAKGMELDDYKRRRKWLEKIWLPEHLDHEYKVVYQGKTNYKKTKRS